MRVASGHLQSLGRDSGSQTSENAKYLNMLGNWARAAVQKRQINECVRELGRDSHVKTPNKGICKEYRSIIAFHDFTVTASLHLPTITQPTH